MVGLTNPVIIGKYTTSRPLVKFGKTLVYCLLYITYNIIMIQNWRAKHPGIPKLQTAVKNNQLQFTIEVIVWSF